MTIGQDDLPEAVGDSDHAAQRRGRRAAAAAAGGPLSMRRVRDAYLVHLPPRQTGLRMSRTKASSWVIAAAEALTSKRPRPAELINTDVQLARQLEQRLKRQCHRARSRRPSVVSAASSGAANAERSC